MKTLNTFLKMATTTLLVVVFASTTIQLNAQESNEQTKEVKIKMIKNINGEETVIDTTIAISDLEDFEGLEDMDVFIGDGNEETMIITKEIEEEIGEDGEIITTIDLIVEVADSLENTKVITLQMDGDEHTVFISDDEEMKTIKTEDGEKTIIIKHKGDASDEDIMIISGDEVNWHEKIGTNVQVEETEDGNKVIITDEDGEIKEYIIKDGEGAFMIDENGNVVKAEGDTDIIWKEEGDNVWVDVETEGDSKVIVIKSKDGTVSTEDMEMTHNVFVTEGGDGEEQEVFVSVIKKQEGDKTIVIRTKVIIETPDEEDKETMEKAGVQLFPESEDNKLKVESLKFSPNPSNGKFSLKFNTSEEGNTDIKIYDLNGAEVYNESLKNFNGTYEKEIDISGEKSGTYFLKVTQGDNIMSRKIVIE